MELIDTHAHLYLPEFSSDLKQVVQRARAAGVTKVLLPNIDVESVESLHAACAEFPDFFFPMMGFHPCSFSENTPEIPSEITNSLMQLNYCAVGEIGLDNYWDKSTIPLQEKGFIEQMLLARQYQIPVSIHCRDAFDLLERCLGVLMDEYGFKKGGFKGVLHCFTGTVDQGMKAIEAGFFLGIGGVVTYKKSGLAETLKNLPIEHIVLETDAPYLSPVPFRGKRNESAYIRHIAEAVSDAKGLSLFDVANITTENAMSVFFDSMS